MSKIKLKEIAQNRISLLWLYGDDPVVGSRVFLLKLDEILRTKEKEYEYLLDPELSFLTLVRNLLNDGLITIKDKYATYSLLGLAILANSISLVDLLLEFNPNIHEANGQGESLLALAVKNKNFEIANKLLDKGININESIIFSYEKLYFKNRTALHTAIIEEYPKESIKFLLAKGANVNEVMKIGSSYEQSVNRNGHFFKEGNLRQATALGLARHQKKTELIDLLKSYDAKTARHIEIAETLHCNIF